MDELGFRGTTSDTLSVSYTPAVKSTASRKAAASRSNVSLSLSQPSRLPSPRGHSVAPSVSPKPSGTNGKAPSTASSPTLNRGGGLAKFKSLRNMLPFGPKQPPSSSSNAAAAAAAATTSSKANNKPLLAPPMQAGYLRHRRSSSSIPTSGMAPVPKGFLSVGRRTSMMIAKEKTLPALPSLPRSHSEDLGPRPPPVLSISRTTPSPSRINTSRAGLPLPDDPSPGAPTPNTFPPVSRDLGATRGRGDLSTIIETELSHLSIFKHSPPPESQKADEMPTEVTVEEVDTEEDDVSDRPILQQLAKEEKDNNNLSIMHGQDLDVTAATADLSASWEAGIADLRRSLQVPADQRSKDGCTSPSSTYSVSPISGCSSTQDQIPPTSLPVTSKSEVQLNSPEGEMDGDHPSFDLSTVDPDLAAMLSPKTNLKGIIDDASAKIAAVVDAVIPPPPTHSSPSPSPEPDDLGRRKSFDPDDAWIGGASSRRTSVSSKRRTLGLQSSPVRKSRPSSLALSSDSHSVTERIRKTSVEKTPITNLPRRPLLSPTPRAESKSPRTSAEDLTETVRRRPRVALSTANGETIKGRACREGLYTTPSHPSTSSSVQMGRVSSDSGQSFRRSSHAREGSITRVYSPTSRSRLTTSLGVSSRINRGTTVVEPLERPATALSAIGRGPPPIPQRNRKRSMSTTTDIRFQSRNNNVPDWMGPRTARAFAAAGLLDLEENQDRPLREKEKQRRYDRDRGRSVVPSRAESRMHVASSRPSFDREYHMNGAWAPPSESAGTTASSMYSLPRAGYSEHGTFPTTGRRRASSRTMTVAEFQSARVESPVTSITSSSNARTLFSASTATSTSLSCSSPHHQYQVAQFESEIASLKEKHSMEMEAILGALADSQRTSKSLREENTELKGRIRDLEEQLADLVDQLDEARRQAQRPRSWQRHSPNAQPLLHHCSSRHESSRASPSRMCAFVRTSVDSLGSDYESIEAHTATRDAGRLLSPNGAVAGTPSRPQTRASMASSVFPNLPSNMSMLLHDEASDIHPSPAGGALTPLQLNAYASSAGSPSASPTLNVNRLVSSSTTEGKGHNRHATNLSLSSLEMSMLSSMPGSPTSLKLKPEHEKHLCDLKSIDFSVVDSD